MLRKTKYYLFIVGWTFEKLLTTLLVAVLCTLIEGLEIFIRVLEDEYWRWRSGLTEIRQRYGSKRPE